MRILLLLSFISLVFLQNTQAKNLRREKPDIEGYWKSVSSEDFHDGTFGTRSYRFEDNSWEETIIIYGDRDLLQPLFRVRYEGFYDITTKSSSIYKAYNINFHFSKKTITILSDDKIMIKEMGFRPCNEGKDQEVDISEKGCSFIASITDYPVQYDIIKKDMDLLFLGIHSYRENIDDIEKRPKYFHYPLRKFNPNKESEWVKKEETIYAMIHFDIKNEMEFNKFLKGYVESMHKYGGVQLNYSSDIQTVQGNATKQNVIIQVWPDQQQFERWWNSRDFKPWKIMLMKHTEASVSISSKYREESKSE